MNRRSLLGALTAAAGGSALAGCLTDSPGADDGDATTTTTSTATDDDTTTSDDPTTPDGSTSTPADPFRTLTVGDPDAVAFPDTHRPHVVDVANDADAEREIGVRVETADRSTGGSVAFPAGGVYRLRLVEPLAHEVVVTPPDGEASRIRVPGRYVDCNDSRTTVTVGPDGRVRHETVSTEVECPPPAVVGRSFAAEDGQCAGDDAGTAAVAFAGESVTVTGSLRTPTPCYGAALDGATPEAEGTVLRVAVGATPPPAGTACVECVGRVGYEARVDFEHDYPDEVVVEHVLDGRRRVVARATP